MTNRAALPHTDDELVSHLARLDELAESGQAVAAADATVASLKAELDTFVAALRESPPASDFESEPGFGKVTAMVQAIGRSPEDVNDKTIDTHSGTNKPSATAETPLGMLGIYELMTKLGEGGMGAVYKARHTKLDKIVAIKVLPAERMKDTSAVARFEREMRAVGKLEHPNIVRAMDAGEAGGMHYLVMEYVQGVDLSQLVKERGPLPIADACELIRQAAVGLDEAHDSHMVHRDIKPSNIMLCVVSKRKPPVVKILDMGLALLSEAHSADVQGLTTTGQMMGTLDYMAPEQGGDSKNVDIRADIYALGASLYKLLCGEAIYHGEKYQTPVQKMMALATHPAPPIQKRRKGVPNELAAVLHRMLEKNPEKRIATPEEVAQALAPFCAGANLAALLNSAGFDVAPTPDNSQSKTQPSFSQPDADTGVSQAPPKASPPLKVAKPIGPGGTGGSPTSAAAAKAKPPVSSPEKTNPALAKAPTPKPSPAPARVDKPPVPPAAISLAPVPHIHTKPTPAKTIAKKTSAARKLPPWVPIAIGGGLLGFAGIAALATAIVFFFQTPNGTLRVEINDPSIEVTVKGTDIVLKQADKDEIVLTPGEHALVVKRGDFTFDTRSFELKKGETTTVKVDLLPGKVQVALADGAILGERAMGTQVATADPRLPTPGTPVEPTSPSTDGGHNGESALNFTGGGGFVEVPSLKLPREGELTIEAYVTARKTRYGFPPPEQIWLAGQEGTAKLIIYDGHWHGYAFHKSANGEKPAPTDERTHLALVRTASQRRLYANGRVIDSYDDITVRPEDNPALFQIGQKEFDGVIDEIRVSNVARYDKEFTPAERFENDDKTLALWHCDEGQGDKVLDSSGNNHHGTFTAAKWLQAEQTTPQDLPVMPGYPGKYVLSFPDHGGTYVEVPTLTFMTICEQRSNKKSLTVELWVQRDRQKMSPHDQIMGFMWNLWGIGCTAGGAVMEGGEQQGYGAAPINFGEATAASRLQKDEAVWMHVAAVQEYDKEKRLYINGRLVDRKPDVNFGDGNKGATPLRLAGAMAGMLGEARISTVARYDKDFTPQFGLEPDADTLGLWHFDEGQGDELRDSSGNNHHGEIVGAKWVRGSMETDQAAVARWLLENKKLTNIGFEVNGQVQPLNAVPSGPCKVRELNFHKFNNGGNILEADIPRLAVFTDLEYLDLSRMPLTDAGLASLAPLKKLKTLSVAETGLTTAAVATIRAFPQLEFVITPSTDDWLKPLAGMPTIRTLSYYRQGISPQAMEWFKQYPNLTELRIVECGVDWTSEKLAPLKDCKQLSKLELSYVPVDDTSVDILCDLKGLVQLTVIETKLTEAGLKKIAAALPKCRIVLKEEDRVLAPTAPTAATGANALRCDELGGVEVPSLKLPQTGPLTIETYCTVREGKSAATSVLLGPRYQFSLMLSRHRSGRVPGDVFILFGKGTNSAGVSNQYGHAAAPSVPEVGRTYHLAGVRTADEFQLFIDGKKVAACPIVMGGSEMFKIGGGCPVDLREIRVSKVARYSADFTPAARFEPDADALALYHCDEGEGDVLRDASGNKHDGEIIGATWIQATEASTIGANSGVFRNSLGMEFVRVPQGSAWLGGSGGNAGGRHVKFDADFYLGRYEVTQAQWLAVMGNNPSAHARSGGFRKTVQQFSDADLARFPVDSVSWDDCQSFLAALNAKEQVAGWTYRLPTEAEWEYACRGGPMNEQSESRFDFYVGQPTIKLLAEQANWANTLQRTTLVGSYPANRLGLYDMHGNVHEWCHEQIPDPRYRERPTVSVYRGGCFHDENPHFVRAAFRAPYKPTFRGMNVGLRLARVPSQPKDSAASGSINVLPLIDPAIDAGGDGGKREGNEIVVGHRSTLALPLNVAGSYQLRAEFTVSAGPKILSVVCPIAGKASSIILSESDNEAGYAGCGISGIDGLPAIDTRNPSHNAAKLIEADKRHALVITASSAGDQVTLRATVDGKPLADWTGAASRLNAAAANSTNQISLSSYKGMLRLHSLQLTMLDGEAQLLRP